MTNTFKKIVAVFGLTVLAGVVSGCDQTADEYHQQQVNDKLALYQKISANQTPYVGTITTQGSTCNFELVFNASMSTSTASDGTASQATAQLQGNVTIDCGNGSETQSVPGMYYFSQDNSTSGSFGGTFNITVTSGGQTSTGQMVLSGTLNGTQMSGNIQMTNPAGLTGSFTASLNGNVGQASTGGNPGVVTRQDYKGTYEAACPGATGTSCNFSIELITELIPSEQGDFFNAFATQKAVSIQLNRSGQVIGSDGTVYKLDLPSYGFQNAYIDLKNRKLDGGQASAGPNGGTLSLHCSLVGVNLQCSLVGMTGGTDIVFTASPVKN